MPKLYERAAAGLRTAIRVGKHYYPQLKAGYKYYKHLERTLRSAKVKRVRNSTPAGGGKYVVKSAKKGRTRYAPGRMAGFVRKGSKVKRSGPKHNVLNDGVFMTTERSNALTGTDTVYIGHASMPYIHQYKIFAMALVKALFKKMHIAIFDMKMLLSDTGAVGTDSINIQFVPSRETAVTIQNQQWTISVFTTVESLCDNIADFLKTLDGSASLEFIYYYPGAGSLLSFNKFNLKNSRVHFTSKSSFKFQNRSVNETGDEDAEDVDNVPLNGKFYEGSGSGTEWNNGTIGARPFYADQYGLISKDGSEEGIKEPPMGQLFAKCKTSGKVRINPGDIKTGVLNTTTNQLINNWLASNTNDASALSYPVVKQGKFQFFALEKMIGGLSEQPISVACEVNLLIGCVVKLGQPSYTTALFSKSVF